MTAYGGNEPYVFISYAHKDENLVLPIIQGLHDRGFRVWYDEGIEVSVAWAKYVGERLEQCSCVLAYVTNNYDDSHNCWQELDFAMEEKKKIVAIKAEGKRRLSAGMRMRLVSIQTMPFEKYGSVEKILEILSQAAVMKPCLGVAAAPAKAAGERQDNKMKKELDNRLLNVNNATTLQKYGFGRAAVPANPVASAPAKKADPGVEELYSQAEEHRKKSEYTAAFLLYKKAAEQGYAPAQAALGSFYEFGKYVKPNKAEARKWYQKAADQGHKDAASRLRWL